MPPRRRGLFGRILDFIRGGPPEPPKEPPPEPPLPPPPPGEAPPPRDNHEDRMREIFRDVTEESLRNGNYGEWRETYDPLGEIFRYHDTEEEDNEEIEQYWDEYLRAFYLTTGEEGHVLRDQFYTDTGIPKDEIDWDLWREIKRGTP